MHVLTHQDELDDDDTWKPNKAASVCLMLLASCCEDDIVNHVLPFVQKNVTNENWQYREAALMAFSSILEGKCHLLVCLCWFAFTMFALMKMFWLAHCPELTLLRLNPAGLTGTIVASAAHCQKRLHGV